jgi:hypothetical protein
VKSDSIVIMLELTPLLLPEDFDWRAVKHGAIQNDAEGEFIWWRDCLCLFCSTVYKRIK